MSERSSDSDLETLETPEPQPSTRLVSVAVPVALDRPFSYEVPTELPIPAPGSRVVVPFGRRVLVGIVRRRGAAAIALAAAPSRLRALIDCLDPPERPALTDDLV
ncbi:MAG: hypothetical protein KC431_01560, partial [Myxococcales bacterium]|nr:hypothetical protein [Myxococcales bacterium]